MGLETCHHPPWTKEELIQMGIPQQVRHPAAITAEGEYDAPHLFQLIGIPRQVGKLAGGWPKPHHDQAVGVYGPHIW